VPATPNLPTPNFTFNPNAPGACIAGVRPYRNSSYRLDAETISGKFIVHNYGHGGAGITLSWGCAAKVRDIVQQHLVTSRDTKAAVLGAGVMGMTAATLLRGLGLTVKIYSDRKPNETTSYKAGGQWAVSVVEIRGQGARTRGNHQGVLYEFQEQHWPGLRRFTSAELHRYPIAQSRYRAAVGARSHSRPGPAASNALRRTHPTRIRISNPADRTADFPSAT
jgi:hypothetical protein